VSKFELAKHNLTRQSGTKSAVKPTWSKKMAVLSPFLEFSLNFLFNNLKKTQNLKWSGNIRVKQFRTIWMGFRWQTAFGSISTKTEN